MWKFTLESQTPMAQDMLDNSFEKAGNKKWKNRRKLLRKGNCDTNGWCIKEEKKNESTAQSRGSKEKKNGNERYF